MKTFGPFRLDPVNHCLWRADVRVPITPKAFDVLRYLVDHSDRLVTHEELLEALWPETYVNPEGIRKYILEVRKVLGDRPGEPEFIETLPKRGYQFVAPVTEERKAVYLGPEAQLSGDVVGRQDGFARLESYFQKALGGQRQMIFVTGEAGIGKTTLVDFFEERLATNPELRIARGQCIEGFGGIEAYYPVLEALSSLFRGAEGASLVQVLAKQAPTWHIQFPALVEAERRESLHREILGSTRVRMARELCETLEIFSAVTPLIIILEDLHWVDPSTLDLISALARRRESAKLLIIGTYRPVDVVLSHGPLKALKQDLAVRSLCHEIAMERLEESDVTNYLTKIFSIESLPPGLANLIHRHSGGNPLFMTAIVQDMVTKGLLLRDRDRLILTIPLLDAYPGIPETLQQMLEIQIERLSQEERRILQSCSIAGERFSVWAAAAMVDVPLASIEDTCDRLAHRQQFIRSLGLQEAPNGAPSAYYEFKHALYRQALYRSLSGVSRSSLHRSLGERLRPICAAGKPELASELALHFEEGRDFKEATRYLMLAAENAAKRFAHRDSIQILRHALDIVPSTMSGGELHIQILQNIGDTYFVLGEMSESVGLYEAAAVQAAKAGLKTAHVGILVRLGFPAWFLDSARGEQVCQRTLEAMEGLDDPLLVARTKLAIAGFRLLYDEWREEDAEVCAPAEETICRLTGSKLVYDVYAIYMRSCRGEYSDASALAEALINATGNPRVYVLACGAKGLAAMFSGRFGEQLRIVRAGRELGEKNGEDPWMYIFGDAWLHLVCFDFEGVRRLCRITMRADAEPHAAWLNTVARMCDGYAEIYRANHALAVQSFAEVRDFRKTPKFFLHWYWRLQAHIGITEAWLSAGDYANARREADGCLRASLASPDPNICALAWELKARVARGEKDFAGARQCIDNGLAMLKRFDIPTAGWRVHATACDVFSDETDFPRAEEHRLSAVGMIMKIADSFDPGEPLRESFLGAPPVRAILARRVSV